MNAGKSLPVLVLLCACAIAQSAPSEPILKSAGQPQYPALPRVAHIEGEVRLEFVLNQNGQVGTDKNGNAQMAWVQGTTDNNTFTATQIGNDANGNLVDKTTGTGGYTASVNGSGVQFSNNGGDTSSMGVFVNHDVNPTSTATNFQDAGWANNNNLSGFNFTFTNSKLEANQTAAGTFTFSGTLTGARDALENAGFGGWPTFRIKSSPARNVMQSLAWTTSELGTTRLVWETGETGGETGDGGKPGTDGTFPISQRLCDKCEGGLAGVSRFLFRPGGWPTLCITHEVGAGCPTLRITNEMGAPSFRAFCERVGTMKSAPGEFHAALSTTRRW